MKGISKTITFLSFMLSAALTAYIMYGDFKGIFALVITILSMGLSIMCAYLYGIAVVRFKKESRHSEPTNKN